MNGRSLVAALALFLATAPLAARTPKIGEPAPDFTLTTMDGRKVTLAELRGQVVVLNFWATWCVPCRQELPTLDAYYRATKQYGLQVYAITTEDSVPVGKLKALFAAMAIPAVKSVRGPYEPTAGVPTNFVIDRAGILRYAKAAAFDLDALNALLIPLLNEQGVAG